MTKNGAGGAFTEQTHAQEPSAKLLCSRADANRRWRRHVPIHGAASLRNDVRGCLSDKRRYEVRKLHARGVGDRERHFAVNNFCNISTTDRQTSPCRNRGGILERNCWRAVARFRCRTAQRERRKECDGKS